MKIAERDVGDYYESKIEIIPNDNLQTQLAYIYIYEKKLSFKNRKFTRELWRKPWRYINVKTRKHVISLDKFRGWREVHDKPNEWNVEK